MLEHSHLWRHTTLPPLGPVVEKILQEKTLPLFRVSLIEMTVFVFGAGVSAPAGFPLSKDLYSDFRKYLFSQPNVYANHEELMDQWMELEKARITWLAGLKPT